MLILCFRAIINHFNPKIESYAAVNHISQLSEEQVSLYFPQSGPSWWPASSPLRWQGDCVTELLVGVARARLLRGISKGFVDSTLIRMMASAFVPYEGFI